MYRDQTSGMERMRDFLHQRAEQAALPLARVLMRLKIRPNQVSVAGAGLNLLAAGLIIDGQLPWAGAAYLVAGSFDLLDGALARIAKQETRFGAFLDSTLDRISEGVVFAAIAFLFARHGAALEASLVVLALLGSLLVSYTRARAEALGISCKGGLLTRAERVLLVAAGLLFGLLPQAIYILVVLTAVTVAQRVHSTSRQLGTEG